MAKVFFAKEIILKRFSTIFSLRIKSSHPVIDDDQILIGGMMRDIQLVLERWGGWAACDNSKIGWSPIANGFKGLLPYEGRSRLSCCDNDGIIIDTAVAMLGKANREDEMELIMLHYMYNVSKSSIARWKKCSEGKIRQKLMVAETFIDACIMMTGSRLEMDSWTEKVVKKMA